MLARAEIEQVGLDLLAPQDAVREGLAHIPARLAIQPRIEEKPAGPHQHRVIGFPHLRLVGPHEVHMRARLQQLPPHQRNLAHRQRGDDIRLRQRAAEIGRHHAGDGMAPQPFRQRPRPFLRPVPDPYPPQVRAHGRYGPDEMLGQPAGANDQQRLAVATGEKIDAERGIGGGLAMGQRRRVTGHQRHAGLSVEQRHEALAGSQWRGQRWIAGKGADQLDRDVGVRPRGERSEGPRPIRLLQEMSADHRIGRRLMKGAEGLHRVLEREQLPEIVCGQVKHERPIPSFAMARPAVHS